ncbi:unnamed protein product [Mytilus edulis]|uniref:Uncharacterized protein n=1 Tax=Mytilus edulis TaxID=6550 RepID=A0A8S3QRT0_MYTED|nr:unnamed protein product [Mytilus edulis]
MSTSCRLNICYVNAAKLLIFNIYVISGQATSSCPFSDPQCHPLCIEYKGVCKYCRCKVISAPSSGSGSSSRDKYGGSGSGSSDRYGGSGSGLSAKWNSNYGLRDNSNSFGGGHTENSGSNSGGNTENTKVIIIHEKDTQTQQMSALPGLPMGGNMGGHMASQMSFNMPHGPMAAQNPFSHHASSYGRGHSMNVPLKSPGIPKYCISVDKMEFEDCSCTVVDEGGCQTCPCYSAPDKASNESKAKCNPPMVMCTNDGNNLMQTMSGGSGGSAGSGGSSGNGSGSGQLNPMGGGSGSGGGMKNPFGSSSGGAGSGTGMKSPFGSSSGGAGSGAGMKSPFSKGGPGAGPGGAPGMGGMGPHGPSSK